MELATLWERTRAIILDLIIVSVLQSVINLTFGSERVSNAIADPATSGGFSSYSSTVAVDGFWLWLAAMTYFVLLESLFGATIGKAVVGIRVTDLEGRVAGWRAILIRNVLRVIDSFPAIYLLGALVARFSSRRQRIGDRLAGTIVVPARAVAGLRLTSGQRRRRESIVIGIVAGFFLGCMAFSYFGRPPIALENLARTGRFPAGQVTNFQHGSGQWNGTTVTFPVTYATATRTCTGEVTLEWHGFLQGWEMSSATTNC